MKCKNSIMLFAAIAYSICSTVGSASVSVIDLIRPKFWNLTVEEGIDSTAEFFATVECGSECRITWYNQHSQNMLEDTASFERNKYEITRKKRDWKLKINDITKNDFGIYQLAVCCSNFQVIQNFHLQVNVNLTIPSLVHMITNYTEPVKVGDDINITCAVYLHDSYPSVLSWEYGEKVTSPIITIIPSENMLITWDKNSSHELSTLYIRNIQKNQSGVYTCDSANSIDFPPPNTKMSDYTELIVHDEEVPEKRPGVITTFSSRGCTIEKDFPEIVEETFSEIIMYPYKLLARIL